jgi:adenine deaminase
MVLPATVKEIQKMLNIARGKQEADLYLDGGNLINVLSGEIYPANVAVWQGRIAYVGKSRGMVGAHTTVINTGGYYLCPALIEAHYHPWVIYNPVSIMEAALPRGITTMVCDNLPFFIQLGAEGLIKLMQALENFPLRLFWMARLLPQSPDPDEEEIFSIAYLKQLFGDPHVLKMAEVTRWPRLVEGNSSLLEKIHLAKETGLGFDGHTAGCSYDLLNAAVVCGIESCHEAITAEEVAQRVRLGLWTKLRYSSLRPHLPELIRAITEMNLSTGRMILTADCPGPSFVAREGLLDGMLRIAVANELNPVTALQMATINPATYLRMDNELGSIAPGRWADILLLPDLENFMPHMVISRGRVVAVDNKLAVSLTAPDWKELGLHTHLPPADLVSNPHIYGVSSDKTEGFPVIKVISAAITRREDRRFKQQDGFLEREEDILYCTLIDRHGKWVTNGFVRGIGQIEALATTFTTSLDFLVLGQDRPAMARAAAMVVEMGGGIVLIEKGEVLFHFPLELEGVMSARPFAEVAGKIEKLEQEIRKLGYSYTDILFTLVFLVADFLPGLRITASGIIDVKSRQVLIPSRQV